MRIGIDLHMVNDFMQGSRTYTYNVTRALLEIDAVNDYYLYFTSRPQWLPGRFQQPNVHIRRIAPAHRLIRLPISFPLKLAADRIDVFHCQYMAPPMMRTPYVITLHDIIHETCPQYYPKILRFFMSLCYPYSARRAAKVLTVSAYSKGEIQKRYRIADDKLVISYDAASDEFRPLTDLDRIAAVKRAYRIESKYILFVGRLEPRKNIPGLIRAFGRVRPFLPERLQLVVAGMKDFMYEELFALAERLNLAGDIVFTGRVAQKDLPLLYNGAELFVYPSFAEGFGIPPLEAMACGVPVISANTTSLPEVVGTAGIMVAPGDIDGLGAAILNVLRDEELRQRMRSSGLLQAEKFNWRQTARVVLETYHGVYRSHPRRGQP